MVYAERNTWSQLIATVAALVTYLTIIVPQLGTTAVGDIQWAWPMIGTIVGAILLSILLSIIWGILSGARSHEKPTLDQRDRDIERLGSRVGQAFLVLGGVGGIALSMLQIDWFWIGNTLYLGFALSSLLDVTTRVVSYRRGLPAW
ncbi:hypothetical protein G7066_05575 [Leucobacter coleopterorum]|uniref:Uncharacterized protein n=1 Tax=Leucobacter coleopterorum TaxID=2714933 RepID=A0ABX6JZN8_9MICO|nr:hypothetical protein [Leucobacter coleopterorum]QIM18255.1 hypothetical protein G7066_05575 [Leucobacter coleopterorum]